MKIACFFAKGFEEVEALGVLNLLKRAGCDVIMIGVSEEYVTSAKGVTIKMDCMLDEFKDDVDCYILPGGMPGVNGLFESENLKKIIIEKFNQNKLICAICAAPVIVLDKWKLLKDKKVTCYTGMQDGFVDGIYVDSDVVCDNNLITSRGVGTVFQFGFAIIEYLFNKDKVCEIKRQICY